MKHKRIVVLGFVAATALLLASSVAIAAALAGAIFTTTPDGAIVNENVRYDDKRDVYLDGGPPPNAPATAAGLPDGYYVFQITDPPGKFLLSQDPARCRVVRVQGGVIVQLVPPMQVPGLGATTNNWADSGSNSNQPCHVADPPTPPAGPGVRGPSGRHDTNIDADHWADANAIVVQMMPYGTTPNLGGVYKAWITPLGTYDAKVSNRSLAQQLNDIPSQVPTGQQKPHACPDFCAKPDAGFAPPRDQVKTDNFKVKEFFPPEITVRKFHDLNGNGVWDAGEPEIGVNQCVDEATGNIIACPGGWPYDFTEPLDGGTITNKFYTPNIHVAGVAGTYKACEYHLTDWTQSAAYVDGVKFNATQCVSVTVSGAAPGEKHEIVFGNFRNATKSGMKFEDKNGNGQKDAGEPGLPGWTIKLDGSDGMGNPVHLSTTTDASGNYSFNVPPGTYAVCEVLKTGWTQSYPASGCYNITLTSGQVDSDNDFGNWYPATKSGMKFHDLNGNGQKDAGEPGLSDWTINLNGTDGKGNAVSLSITTDASGNYSFSVPPGTYTVCEVLKTGWTQSYPGGDGCYHITLISRQVDSDNDFGNWYPATKSGYKFKDTNGNGVWDAGELGLSGWTIKLDGSDGMGNAVHLSTTTDANGKYSFSVPPGTYIVCEVQRAGWMQTYPASGCYNITLVSGQVDNDNNFGNRPNQGCTPGYWKVEQHWDSWTAPWTPGGPLSAMFDGVNNPPYFAHVVVWDQMSVQMGLATQVQALSFQGGDTIPEKAEILLRAAVAAVLNAAHPAVNYPWTEQQVMDAVNAALASQDATTIINLANQLDRDNNGPGGCPLN